MAEETETEAPAQDPRLQALVDAITTAMRNGSAQVAGDDAKARHAAMADTLGEVAKSLAPHLAKLIPTTDPITGLFEVKDPPSPGSVVGDALTAFFTNVGMVLGLIFTLTGELGRVRGQPIVNYAWQQYPDVPLSPADLADMVMRGIFDYGTAYAEAAMTGINGQRFDNLVKASGEPPGPIDMLKLELRGALPPGELDKAIRYSRIHDDYLPYVKMLAYTQMSAADAIEAAIKEVVPLSEARALFTRAGGLDGDFTTLYEAAGDSIGIQQALTLWKFGQITEQDVNLALGRSRINPIFYPIAKKTHFHPLSAFQIARAVSAGTITPATAEQWLIQDGTPPDQAHALATAHGSTGTAKAHTETMTLVSSAYEEQILTRAAAMTALTNIGYHADVANLILEVADAKRANKQQTQAVDVVRANYVARRIDRTQATNDLDVLQIPPDARNKWLVDWDLEIEARPKTLTAVQLATAGKDGFLPPADVYHRIVGLGYDASDAKVLMQLHKAPLPPGV